MNRRAYLTATAAVVSPLGTGCVAVRDGGPVGVTEDDGGDGSSPTASGTATADPPTASDEGSPSPTGTLERSPTATSTPKPPTATPTPEPSTAREQYPDYEWGKLDAASPVASTRIRLTDTSGLLQSRRVEFRPVVAAVEPGTRLTVENDDSDDHTFTAPRLRVDRKLASGESVAITLKRLGTFDYVCAVDPPGELGRVVVTEDLPTPTPTLGPGGNTSGNP